jgi:heat shock protein HslJ
MSRIKKQTVCLSTVVLLGASLWAGITPVQAQSVEANSQVTTIPKGTLVRVLLQRALDSTTMEVGDRVSAQIAPDDPNGIPKDCILVGRVTEVTPATKTAPGIIDIHFGALERAGSPWQGVSVDLIVGNQPRVGQTADVAVTGQTTQQPNTKIIGYGAGAGAVLGSLFHRGGRSTIRGGVLGAIAGAVAAETTRNKTGQTTYQDVKLPAGTELTVTLNQPITVQNTVIVTSGDSSVKPPAPTISGLSLRPTNLMGNDVPNYPGTRKLYIQLTKDGKAWGFAGVNTFTGTYKVGATSTGGTYPLTFSPLAATKMAGPAATMKLENQFLKTLAATTSYRLEGQTISFLSGNKVIARFQKTTAP